MDINLLVLNVGNSRLAIGVFRAGAMEHVTRIAHADRDQWKAALTAAWGKLAAADSPAIAAASVNPAIFEALEHTAEQSLGQKVELVGRDIELPIKVLTDSPSETGVDRILNIAAAYEQMQKACVVVDAGSAVTVDLCNDAGEFLGGAIAPGAAMMLHAMHEQTAKLPEVALEVPAHPFGKSTRQAMLHGVYHGIRGMVKELVENYATELGTWPDLIATGGDSPILFENWELVHAIAPDLTLYGIALAYTNHYIKHKS
ncbi:MAG TPA: type III pantothenate kinase [Tepidisphaeraceae bacterium]|jgi:type III pantothenate kinase